MQLHFQWVLVYRQRERGEKGKVERESERETDRQQTDSSLTD